MTTRERIERCLARESDPERRKFWERELMIQDHIDRHGYAVPFVAPADFFA